jgi:hypothetical protein
VVGCAVLVRYSAVALLPPALLAIGALPRRGTASLASLSRGVAGFGAGFAACLLPLPFWWRACFGSWSPPPYGGRWVITAASPWNVLFGPVHGLFLFHPALLCAAAGLALLALPDRAWRWIALSWFLAVAGLHGWWSESANPGGYGQRFLIDALPPLALGFAGWLRPGPGRPLRIGLGLAAALAGALLFFAAVGGLVTDPTSLWPWPQRLSDYAGLLRHPPGGADLAAALGRSSFLLRGVRGILRGSLRAVLAR